jgi:peptidoglycan-associated lipoprotein
MVKKYICIIAGMALVASVSLFSVGCSKKTIRTDSGAEKAVSEPVGQVETPKTEEQPIAPIGTEESLDTAPIEPVSDLTILEGRSTGPMLPVYFDFDQSNIRADQKGRVENNAAYLKDNPQGRVVIEGNCDERGTNEYNMALGERRAISTKKYIVNLGVSADRVNTISYGEERPLNYGHDELAWSQNRRADFVEIR